MPTVAKPDSIRAQVLIMAAQGKRTDAIAKAAGVAPVTVRKWIEAARAAAPPPKDDDDILEAFLSDARSAMRVVTQRVESGEEDPMLVAKMVAMMTPALKHASDRRDRMVGVAQEIERMAADHITPKDPAYDDIHTDPELPDDVGA